MIFIASDKVQTALSVLYRNHWLVSCNTALQIKFLQSVLNCRKRAFFDKITLLLDLGSHFKSVSEAIDLDSIVFPVRSNSRMTRFEGITNTASILMLFNSHPYHFLITFQSVANFTIGLTRKVQINELMAITNRNSRHLD